MPNIYLIIAAVAALGFIGWQLDSNGYNRCEARYEENSKELEDQSNLEIEEINNTTKERVNNVRKAPKTDDAPVAPVLERVLDSLRSRHGSGQ